MEVVAIVWLNLIVLLNKICLLKNYHEISGIEKKHDIYN